MSFVDIYDNFEAVARKIKEGGQQLSSVCSFFKGLHKASDKFGQKIRILANSLQSSIHEPTDALSNSLLDLSAIYKQISSVHTSNASFILTDIVEPLSLFANHFADSNLESTSQGHYICRKVKKAQQKVRNSRSKYFEVSSALEESHQNAQNYHRLMAQKALGAHTRALDELNAKWADYDRQLPQIMRLLEQSQLSRINFLKLSLEKCSSELALPLDSVFSINALQEVSHFVGQNRAKAAPRDQFISYESWKESTNDVSLQDYIILEEAGYDQEFDLLSKMIEFLVQTGETPTSAEYTQMADVIASSDGRALFLDLLDQKRELSQLSAEAMMQMVATTKSLLAAIVIEQTSDPYAFFKIAQLSQVFHTKEAWTRRYLSSYIAGHSLWSNQQYWVDAILKALSEKNEADRESQRRKEASKNLGLFGSLKSMAGRLPFMRDMKQEKSALFAIASQFNFYMIHLGVQIETAADVILRVCKSVQLEPERTCYLLAELQSNQKSSQILKVLRRVKGLTSVDRVLAHVLTYLKPSELLSPLLVCKHWSRQLKLPALKLTLLQSKATGQTRPAIWAQLMEPPELDYFKILEDLDYGQIEAVADIIDMDVARSYHNNEQIPPQVLKNLLKAFAFYQASVGYCQGMNYIAGTLYIQIQDEALAFRCFVQFVRRFDMRDLYVKNLPKLKQFFFQLDRLISMTLPDVHGTFREVGVCAGHFSSSWFITLYASILPSDQGVLLRIWDLFMVKGWKVIFRVAIGILESLSKDIVGAEFDHIMFLLSSVGQKATQARIFDELFFKRLKLLPVSDELLRRLDEEYQTLKMRAEYLEQLCREGKVNQLLGQGRLGQVFRVEELAWVRLKVLCEEGLVIVGKPSRNVGNQ